MDHSTATALERDGRALTDDEQQAARVLAPRVSLKCQEIASRAGQAMTRAELAKAITDAGRYLAQLRQVMLRSAVAGDQDEVNLDDKRRHVVAVHANGAGMDLGETELEEFHHADHTGPGGIRHHAENDHSWDPAVFETVMHEKDQNERMKKGEH